MTAQELAQAMTKELIRSGATPEPDTEKLRIVRGRILAMVTHAEAKFSLGVKFSAISQKMLKAARTAGCELGELIETMNREGEIFLYTDPDYSRLIMTPDMRAHYILDELGGETPETKNFIAAKWGRMPKKRSKDGAQEKT